MEEVYFNLEMCPTLFFTIITVWSQYYVRNATIDALVVFMWKCLDKNSSLKFQEEGGDVLLGLFISMTNNIHN